MYMYMYVLWVNGGSLINKLPLRPVQTYVFDHTRLFSKEKKSKCFHFVILIIKININIFLYLYIQSFSSQRDKTSIK